MVLFFYLFVGSVLKGTNQQSGGRAVNCVTQTGHMQLTKQQVPSASLGAPP